MSILTSFSDPVRACSAASWRDELHGAVRDVGELCRRLQLPPEIAETAASGAADFSVFVPPSYLARIRPGDPRDPLLLQVLPSANEASKVVGFSQDPVGDTSATLRPGVLKKYAGRALLIATGACAVHCRYCFRRHYAYEEIPHSDAAWNSALQTIDSDPSISEVILSGGDPLMLVDQQLARLVERIAAIPHVLRLRVHTRLPIMVPSRVTTELLDGLTASRLTTVMVLHANHAQELSDELAQGLERLSRAGILLLNQAVLLREINETVTAQKALCERLIDLGVVPYYLHQLDRVAGAAHFEVPIAAGQRLMAELRAQLPGYAVPRYVQEVAGELHKVVLA